MYWEQGLSTYKIAEMYRVSYESVRYWLKKYGIPRRPKPQVVEPKLTPSPELAYVLGVLFGDGTVAKCKYENKKLGKKGYRYNIRLAVVEKRFAEEFMNALEKLGLHPKLYFAPRSSNEKMICDPTKVKPRWVVIAQSKKFFEFFKSLTIDRLENIVKGYEPYFIKGFYESEGSIDRSPKEYRVRIVNTNKELIMLIKQMLERLGFKPTIYTQYYVWNNEKKQVYVIQLYGDKQAKRFFKIIKPCIRNPF